MLVRLAYVSKPKGDVVNLVRSFLLSAQSNNSKLGITSFLVAHNDFLFQELEGEHIHVSHLYSKIEKDPRHYDCTVLKREVATTLNYPIWDIAIATIPINKKGVALPFINFDPHADLSIPTKHMIELIHDELSVRKYYHDMGMTM